MPRSPCGGRLWPRLPSGSPVQVWPGGWSARAMPPAKSWRSAPPSALRAYDAARGEDFHEVSVGVVEVGASAPLGVLAVIDLPDFLAGGVAIVGDSAVLDASEGGVEL